MRLVRPHAPERALKSLVTVVATMVIKNSLLGFAHGTILPRAPGPARVVKRNPFDTLAQYDTSCLWAAAQEWRDPDIDDGDWFHSGWYAPLHCTYTQNDTIEILQGLGLLAIVSAMAEFVEPFTVTPCSAGVLIAVYFSVRDDDVVEFYVSKKNVRKTARNFYGRQPRRSFDVQRVYLGSAHQRQIVQRLASRETTTYGMDLGVVGEDWDDAIENACIAWSKTKVGLLLCSQNSRLDATSCRGIAEEMFGVSRRARAYARSLWPSSQPEPQRAYQLAARKRPRKPHWDETDEAREEQEALFKGPRIRYEARLNLES